MGHPRRAHTHEWCVQAPGPPLFNLKNEEKEKSKTLSKEAADPAQDMSSAVETIRKTLRQRRQNNSVQQVAARVQQMRTEPERLKVLVRELQTMETQFQETSEKITALAKGP